MKHSTISYAIKLITLKAIAKKMLREGIGQNLIFKELSNKEKDEDLLLNLIKKAVREENMNSLKLSSLLDH